MLIRRKLFVQFEHQLDEFYNAQFLFCGFTAK